MSDVDKMYKAPDKLGEIQTPVEGGAGVSANTRVFIGQAAPWMKFLGVMGFIGCGFMALCAIILMVLPSAFSGLSGSYAKLGAGMGVGVGVGYLIMAVLFFFPARFMFRMGSAASSYKIAAQAPALEDLVSNLKKWATFNGILVIICIGLGVLAFIGVIIFSIARARGGSF